MVVWASLLHVLVVQNCHWLLFAALPKLKTLLVLDSLASAEGAVARTEGERLLRFGLNRHPFSLPFLWRTLRLQSAPGAAPCWGC